MLGRKQNPVMPVVVGGPANAREVGEHEALASLQRARKDRDRAAEAKVTAARLTADAEAAYDEARREVRRIAER